MKKLTFQKRGSKIEVTYDVEYPQWFPWLFAEICTAYYFSAKKCPLPTLQLSDPIKKLLWDFYEKNSIKK